MKKIGLLSDTHGWLDERLLHHFADCDELWHAGDFGSIAVAETLAAFKPLRAVWGNIDGGELRYRYPENQDFDCEGLRVWMTHIGGYPGRYPARIKARLRETQPDLFICGHSHILKAIWDETHHCLHLNPGACGREGFHHIRTALRFNIAHGEVKDIEVIELGSRSSILHKATSQE